MAEEETPAIEESIDESTLPEPEPELQAPIGEHVHVHTHPEHDDAISKLEARCTELERKVTELHGQLKRAREERPEDDHFWFRKVGGQK